MKYLLFILLLSGCGSGPREIVIFGGSNSNYLSHAMNLPSYGHGGSALSCDFSDNCWNGVHVETMIAKIRENRVQPNTYVLVQMAQDSNHQKSAQEYQENFEAVRSRLEQEFGQASWSVVKLSSSYTGNYVEEIRDFADRYGFECKLDLDDYPSEDGIHLRHSQYPNLAKDLKNCLGVQ